MNQFINQNMLTCIGNKRKLVKHIYECVLNVSKQLGKEKLDIVDGFCGSSVVSRQLSYIANELYSNDLELYSYLMSICYMQIPSEEQKQRIQFHITVMNEIAKNGPFSPGIICKLYSPRETGSIKEGERCFYTRENALIIDTLRKYIAEKVEDDIKVYTLVPLLNKASIHTNTSGVFKGFYKNKDNIGQFGGTKEVALSRILKPIELEIPIWNNLDYKHFAFNEDILTFIHSLNKNVDIIYLDPPYNQHPYGSNYFMLNIIAKNVEPEDISKISGIPKHWNKSDFNSRQKAIKAMEELINVCVQKSKYTLISYNNEGIIQSEDWDELFTNYHVIKKEILYDTFKGSRNMKDRSNKVIEIIYVVRAK
jgi:adenine-specific DNA-methyltransferase